ncbi:hypothetical protein JCM19241_1426 [Vibrio ishigakensis]|uniref:DUF3081 domain-containing protein n=1 Tax=Vibrio ishigakensis TaxID=1481914 RepID=A0A0B8QIW5_9VIBR|nr:hypothetical protein JCM19236_4178 [Vibrio sp. JCM 19236]GAM75083.1 hypothetical protein JCM19241_1426 [Vibrio ishigakensis]
MDSRLTVKEFLKVFDCVRSNGERTEDSYQLGMINAWHDYDGYTCWIGYKDVTVTLMFHGALKIEYRDTSHYNEFIQQCLALTASKPLQ